MENVDLPPPYSVITNVPMPSAEALISPQEIVVKEHKDEDPLVSHVFEDKCIRTGFIQKILLCLLMQAVAVLIIMYVILLNRYWISIYWDMAGYKHYKSMQVYVFPTLCSYLITMALLIFSDKARTENPYKIIIFVIYPIIYAMFVTFSTLTTTIDEMFIAWIFYCIAIFVLLMYSIFTFQTNWEFTTKSGIIIAAGVLLGTFSITALAASSTNSYIIFYYTVAMFVECAYAVWDIQQMMSPTYRYAITPTDFVLGVLLIRIDYIYYITSYIKKYMIKCFKD